MMIRIDKDSDFKHKGGLAKPKGEAAGENQPSTPLPENAPFSLVDLLSEVGLENVTFQHLSESLRGSNTNKKGVTKITFETREVTTNDLIFDGKNKIGLVVWIKKQAWDQMVVAHKKP